MNRSLLLQRLQAIYARLVLGDRATASRVAQWKRLAKAGNPRAKVAYNSLAVLHWARRDKLAFARAEIFYNRLRAFDRQAHAELRQTVARKNAGDRQAQAWFSTLKAVHHKRKASLWTTGPGAPSTGYHPMPTYHRVGIDIPGAMNQLGQMANAYIPQPPPQMYLPLTPQAVAMLLQVINQILAMARAGGAVRSMNPDLMANDLPVSMPAPSTVPGAAIQSTVKAPVTVTMAKVPKLLDMLRAESVPLKPVSANSYAMLR